jgi:phosphatidylglycerol:prolipoprotein diacylglycerol transferase
MMVVDFDPVLISLGPVQVRWYGLMYVVGFLVGAKMFAHLCKTNFIKTEPEKADIIMTYALIGMFIFARLFYVVIYNWEGTNSFIDAIAVWRGGLSFHGAAVGFILATILFCKKFKLNFWMVMDGVCLCSTPGLFFGRMGNFINGELYGRVTDVPWAMVFASDPNRLPRHPSQLYQAITEGLILLGLTLLIKSKTKRYGMISSGFLIGYGVLRYFIEFFREADSQLGYYFGGTTTMGQILCFIMIVTGIGLNLYLRRKKELLI